MPGWGSTCCCRFDYSRYQFEVGATIALVLPAWNEFAETHAEELSKAVESDGGA